MNLAIDRDVCVLYFDLSAEQRETFANQLVDDATVIGCAIVDDARSELGHNPRISVVVAALGFVPDAPGAYPGLDILQIAKHARPDATRVVFSGYSAEAVREIRLQALHERVCHLWLEKAAVGSNDLPRLIHEAAVSHARRLVRALVRQSRAAPPGRIAVPELAAAGVGLANATCRTRYRLGRLCRLLGPFLDLPYVELQWLLVTAVSGTRGEASVKLSRILAVVLAFDRAIQGTRYFGRPQVDVALSAFRAPSGTRLDPDVADILADMARARRKDIEWLYREDHGF